jgi:hypothetical protein
MVYSSAVKSSKQQPCTNVPIACALCAEVSSSDQEASRTKIIPTIWKYNLETHICEHHIQPDGKYPSLPPSMVVSSHISQEEGQLLGVEEAKTLEYRTNFQMPGSDVRHVEEGQKKKRRESDERGLTPLWSEGNRSLFVHSSIYLH